MKSESKDFVLVAGTYTPLMPSDVCCVLCAVMNGCNIVRTIFHTRLECNFRITAILMVLHCVFSLNERENLIHIFNFYFAKGMGGSARWCATC